MATVETATEIHPFEVDIPEEALEDLRRREQPEIFDNELRAAFGTLR